MDESWRLEWLHEETYLGEDGSFKLTGKSEWRVDDGARDWPLEKIIEYMAFFKKQYEIPTQSHAHVHARVVNNESGEIIPSEIF